MPGQPQSSTRPWWRSWWILVAIVGWAAVVVWSDKKLEATATYVYFVTLVVLWWYAHLTSRLADVGQQQVALGRQQVEHGYTLRHESNKPFVVLERERDPSREGWFHYWVHNIGPGIAVNVFHVLPNMPTPDEASPVVNSLGALGPGARRVLPKSLDDHFCGTGSYTRAVALIAEGIYTRTGGDRWICTLNALTPTGDVLSRIKWTRTDSKTVSELLDKRWPEIRAALAGLAENAKGLA